MQALLAAEEISVNAEQRLLYQNWTALSHKKKNKAEQ